MAEAHQPGRADQQLEAEREDRVDRDPHDQVLRVRRDQRRQRRPASTIAAAGTSQPPGSRRAMSGSGPTSAVAAAARRRRRLSTPRFISPSGRQIEDDRHQQVDADAAPFGEEHLAEGVDEADQQRGDSAPVIEPMPPMTTTTKQMMSTLRAHARIDRGQRRGDHPGERRQRHAAGEDDAVEQADVDAEAAHHVAVAGAGADHHAEPGAVDDGVEADARRRCRRPTRRPGTTGTTSGRRGESCRRARPAPGTPCTSLPTSMLRSSSKTRISA